MTTHLLFIGLLAVFVLGLWLHIRISRLETRMGWKDSGDVQRE